jgi:hypothetical protein
MRSGTFMITGDAEHITEPVVTRYGDPGFIDAYGAAWGFRDVLVQFFAPDGVYCDVASGVEVQGRSMLDRFMKVYLGFSPTCTVTFTGFLPHEGGFAAPWVWDGTNDGPLWLHGAVCPQDGSPFSIEGVSLCTVDDDGLIATHADYWDSEALLRTWRGEPAPIRPSAP